MDVDAYIAAHRPTWQRLEQLVRAARNPRRLTGAEADELVELYQRVATHLSVIQSSSPDPVLVARLSSLVARARAAISGAATPAWRDAARFFVVGFPAAVYRTVRWWVPTAVVSLLVALATALWVAGHPAVQRSLATPAEVHDLVTREFADYYSSAPAASFAAHVWTNNLWVAAGCLVAGVLLGLPVLYILFQNISNLGAVGGLMAANHRTDIFFGLVLPHGMLELTAVFIAAGIGLRLGWTVVAPGGRSRADALAEEGRTAVGVALGLVVVLLVSGAIEGFVTPSGLPTWARVGIGGVVELAFLAYIVVFGRRAVRAGETGDLDPAYRGDALPTAG